MTQLEDCFDSIVISGELGIGKPDIRAFLHAAKDLNLPPSDVIMVGDSWERDVIGAINAGMSAVWLSNGRSTPDDLPKVTVIESIGALNAVLAS